MLIIYYGWMDGVVGGVAAGGGKDHISILRALGEFEKEVGESFWPTCRINIDFTYTRYY